MRSDGLSIGKHLTRIELLHSDFSAVQRRFDCSHIHHLGRSEINRMLGGVVDDGGIERGLSFRAVLRTAPPGQILRLHLFDFEGLERTRLVHVRLLAVSAEEVLVQLTEPGTNFVWWRLGHDEQAEEHDRHDHDAGSPYRDDGGQWVSGNPAEQTTGRS